MALVPKWQPLPERLPETLFFFFNNIKFIYKFNISYLYFFKDKWGCVVVAPEEYAVPDEVQEQTSHLSLGPRVLPFSRGKGQVSLKFQGGMKFRFFLSEDNRDREWFFEEVKQALEGSKLLEAL